MCICIRENDADMTLWSFRQAIADTPERPAKRQSLRTEPALLTNVAGQGLDFDSDAADAYAEIAASRKAACGRIAAFHSVWNETKNWMNP